MSSVNGVPTAQRILLAFGEALRARRSLPRKDPRGKSAMWLMPNWPAVLVVRVHQKRLIATALDEPHLRTEARGLLHLQSPPEVPAGLSIGQLALMLAGATDQACFLAVASTHPDLETARSAMSFLTGETPTPPRAPAPIPQPRGVKVADPSDTSRHEIRELRAAIRLAEANLAAERVTNKAIRADLDRAVADLTASRSTNAQLQSQLPSKKQKLAIQVALDHEGAVRKAERQVRTDRAAHQAAIAVVLSQKSALETQVGQLRDELETERTSRQRLGTEIGDAATQARRLAGSAERERLKLSTQIVGMKANTDRTRLTRRATQLADLIAKLGDVYGTENPTESGPVRRLVAVPRGEDVGATTEPVDEAIRLTPVGGFNHVGGSCMLVETATTRIFVDVGLRPGISPPQHPGPKNITDHDRPAVDAIVITHAHADHAGFVPWLAARHRRAKVICTPHTAALLPTVWHDSVSVMRAEADSIGRRLVPTEPPYSETDVELAENAVRELPCGQTLVIGDIEVTLFPVGHILGAAGVVLAHAGRRIVITGDIDDRPQKSVAGARIPRTLTHGADLLVIESTYCDRTHADKQVEGETLIAQAKQVLDGGGRVLIPAFGLGRAQEIALLVREFLPGVRVLIDGLARDLTDLYVLNGAPEVFGDNIVKVTDRARQIKGFQNGIVITTSGMSVNCHGCLVECGHGGCAFVDDR